MDLLGRIDRALSSGRLDARTFEECATDLLSAVFPGISPISGGTDWGRDADIHHSGRELADRLLVTTSRTYAGVRGNMLSGLESMSRHGVTAERIVLANPALLSQLQRDNLAKAARKQGAKLDAVYDRRFFISRLRRDGEWRRRLLGVSPEPISLSRSPADLAESPWVSLTLTARDAILDTLTRSQGDLVVTGQPGVGKTRLVATLDGVVFVDAYAGLEQIADDLRAQAPQVVALDDAGQHAQLVRGLARLRRTERDLLDFRIITVCWPDEVAQLLDALGQPAVLDVPLLERAAIDQIVTEMGVTSMIARYQIVDQAQGRPGWAIALASMFTAQRTWTSLFDGQVLLREVQRFLRQSSAPHSAVDLLAMIAAVGSVTLADLPAISDALGLDHAEARGALTRSAHAGLVDVAKSYDARRTYRVRPQMLADVLVADRVFRADVPPFTLPALTDLWPERAREVARVAINSARLGADGARPTARTLVVRLRQSGASTGTLERDYAMIDSLAGRETLGWIRERFVALQACGRLAHGRFEDEIETCALIARTYHDAGAVRLLLDVAVIYAGPTNRSIDPLSKLEDALSRFHPELAQTSQRLRRVTADTLDTWIAARCDDTAAWNVYARALKAVLNPHKRTAIGSAADPNEFTLYEGLIGDTEIEALHREVWPQVRTRLDHAPAAAVAEAIGIAGQWLRIGSGHDLPFGRPHPQHCVDAARRVGVSLLRDLEPRAFRDAGLTAVLARTGDLHGIEVDIVMDDEQATFFAPIDRAAICASRQRLTGAIARIVDGWDHARPRHVAAKLVQLRAALLLAHVTWPDRVQIACERLARDSDRLAEWIDVSLEHELFPSAAPFVDALLERHGSLPPPILDRALDTPNARSSVLTSLLVKGDDKHAASAIKHLGERDADVLDALAVPAQLPKRRLREILATAPPTARGRFALALFAMTADTTAWPPADIAREWRGAITTLNLSAGQEHRHDVGLLFEYLAARDNEIAQDFADRALRHVVDSHAAGEHRAITERLHLLPPTFKTAALTNPDYRAIRALLVCWLVGRDAAWTAQMLRAGTLTPGDVLMSRSGLRDEELSIPQLAELLVPYDIEPARIAEQAQFGSYWGTESAHYAALVEQFAEYAASHHAHVALVGRSGVDLFTEHCARARASEQRERVYGE